MPHRFTFFRTLFLVLASIVCIQYLWPSHLHSQDIIPQSSQSEKDSVNNLSNYENWLTKYYQAKLDLINTIQNYSDLGLKFKTTGPKVFKYEQLGPIYPELYKSNLEKSLDLISSGGSPNLLISPAQIFSQFQIKSEWEKGSRFSYNLIPSNLQLEVLRTLWENSTASMLELYASLDSKYLITAENLNRQLNRMMRLGMVERKIISPQNLFSITMPFKMFQLEMSSKNRKNKHYLYRPVVNRERILQLLLTKSYQIRNEEGSESDLERINKKINTVVSGS